MMLAHWARAITAVAAVTGGAPAIAADLMPSDLPPAPEIPIVLKEERLWQGLSLGLLGVYGFGRAEEAVTHLNDLHGPMLGVFAGINGQHGSWVFGAEFDGSFGAISAERGYEKKKNRMPLQDFSDRAFRNRPKRNVWQTLEEEGSRLPTDGPSEVQTKRIATTAVSESVAADNQPQGTNEVQSRSVNVGQDRARISIDEFYTFRGRVGFAFDDLLLYGTGGLGIAHVKLEAKDIEGGFRGQNYGVTPVVGAGLEYKISPDASLRAEYLYASPLEIGIKAEQKLANGSEVKNRVSPSIDGTHMIRVGVSYHLPIQ